MSGKGMSFLNKKSWHTGGMRMIEKVWQAEEKAAAEQKKIDQWRKELEEERKIDALRRMQADAGLLTRNQVERLDWMYTGAGAFKEDEAKETEAFLLGKVKKEVTEGISDIKALASAPGAMLIPQVKAETIQPGMIAPSADGKPIPYNQQTQDHKSRVKAELEASALLREDPLMSIMRQSEARKSSITSNPHLMQKMKEEILREKLAKELLKQKHRDEKKKAKKAAKEEMKRVRKEKKRAARSSRSRSRSRNSSSDSSRSASRDRTSATTSVHAASSTSSSHPQPPANSLAAKYGLIQSDAAPSDALARKHSESQRQQDALQTAQAQVRRQDDAAKLAEAWSAGGAEELHDGSSRAAAAGEKSRLYVPSGSKALDHKERDAARKSKRSDSRERRRSRSPRKNSPERSRDRDRTKRRHDSRSRSRSRSRSPPSKRRSHSPTSRRSHGRRSSRSRSRSRSPRDSRNFCRSDRPSRSPRREDRDGERDRDGHRDRDGKRKRSRSHSRSRSRSRDHSRRELDTKRPRLASPPPAASSSAASAPPLVATSSLAIAPALAPTTRVLPPTSSSSRPATASTRPTLTPEERAARLAAMSADANDHDEAVKRRAMESLAAKQKEERDAAERLAKARPDAAEPVEFIQKLNANVYSGTHETLEQRINKNKHSLQRTSNATEKFL